MYEIDKKQAMVIWHRLLKKAHLSSVSTICIPQLVSLESLFLVVLSYETIGTYPLHWLLSRKVANSDATVVLICFGAFICEYIVQSAFLVKYIVQAIYYSLEFTID